MQEVQEDAERQHGPGQHEVGECEPGLGALRDRLRLAEDDREADQHSRADDARDRVLDDRIDRRRPLDDDATSSEREAPPRRASPSAVNGTLPVIGGRVHDGDAAERDQAAEDRGRPEPFEAHRDRQGEGHQGTRAPASSSPRRPARSRVRRRRTRRTPRSTAARRAAAPPAAGALGRGARLTNAIATNRTAAIRKRKPACQSGASSRFPIRIATRFVPISTTSADERGHGRRVVAGCGAERHRSRSPTSSVPVRTRLSPSTATLARWIGWDGLGSRTVTVPSGVDHVQASRPARSSARRPP